MDVTDDMRLRLEHDFSPLNWSFHSTVDNHPIGRNDSSNLGLTRDDEGSAMQFTFDLPVDFHQALRGDAANNLQPFGDNCSVMLGLPT